MAVTPVTGTGTGTAAQDSARAAGSSAGVRAAIVGTGFMGRVHARSIRVAGAHLVGVVGSSPERAAAALPDLGAAPVFGSIEELLERAEVDVVHVCTPNHLHAATTLAALASGAHVVCEKPLSTDAASAAEMTTAAHQRGRVATVPFVYRFYPMVREARLRVAEGEIGAVALAHGSYLQDWLLRPTDDNWRVDTTQGGPTRAFGDIGSHWCDLLEFVTGDRITRISAQVSTVNQRRGDDEVRVVRTEDIVTLQFATRNGALGTAVISQVSAGRKNRLVLEVSGADATLRFDQENPETLWHGRREVSSLLVRDPDLLRPGAARYARVPAGHPQGYQDCFDAFVADTYAAIAGAAPDGLPTFDDGLRAARLAEAVLESARTSSWTEVPG